MDIKYRPTPSNSFISTLVIASHTWFERFDGYRSCVVPQTLPYFAKLTVSDLFDHTQGILRYLPLILCLIRQALCLWLICELQEKD